MDKRIIPSSQEQIPVIGLGTYKSFDVGSSSRERASLEEVLRVLSINEKSMIDSSPMYGRSEGVVGDLAEKAALRKKLFLATKVWTSGKEAGIAQMNKSFQLMKTEVMDLMQIHNLVDWKTHLPTLRKWKEQGKIRYTGITHYTSGAYAQVEQVMKQEQFDFLQINYSMAKREAEERLLPMAADKGMAVIVNMPFDSGSLFSLARNKSLPDFAKEFDCHSWAQYFLKFILSNQTITCVIPATSNPAHLQDFLAAGSGKLPDGAMRKRMLEYLK
ncbi:MAG: aldo/keto reductase [Cytophagaceae bacterium]